MARKCMVRDLPALSTLFPDFRGFPASATGVHALSEVLRRAVGNLAGATAQPFYAQRELAAFFGVTRRTVTLACRRLVREGRLRTRVGAGTWIAERQGSRLTTVRGVVGLPLWVPGFVNFAEWRMFYILLEERLRQADFAPEILFYLDTEAGQPEMALRLARHRLDQVVWFTPDARSMHILRALAQQGTRVTVVSDADRPPPFPCYQLSWRNAVQRGLRCWARAGVATAVAARGSTWLTALARQAGIRLAATGRLAVEHLLAAPATAHPTGLILDDDYEANHLCRRAPEALASLMAVAPVMTLRGLDFAPPSGADLRLDAAVIDWERLAARIAADMAADRLPSAAEPTRVQATWCPRLPLERLASGRYLARWG